MHQREIIRTAVAAALAGSASAQSVSENRLNPFRVPRLPAIDIVSVSDDVDDDSINTAPRELEHSYVVAIRAWVAVTSEVDKAMDDMAEEIEPLMHADPYFGGAAAESILTGTDFEFRSEGNRDVGAISLIYKFTYRTCAQAAPAGLDDFNTAYATHNIGNAVHEDEDAEDDIEVQV